MAEISVIAAPVNGTVRVSGENSYVGTLGIKSCIGIYAEGRNGISLTHLAPYGIGSYDAYDEVGQKEQIHQLLEREKDFLGKVDYIEIAYFKNESLANIAREKAKEFCEYDVGYIYKPRGKFILGRTDPSTEHTYHFDFGGTYEAFVIRSELNLNVAGIAGLFLNDHLTEIAYSEGKWQDALIVAPEVALITQNLLLVDKGKHGYALDAAEKILKSYPDCWRGLSGAHSEWSQNEKIQAVSKFLVLRAGDLEKNAQMIGEPLDPCSSFDVGYEKNYGEKVPSQPTTIELRIITGKQFNAYHVEQKIDTRSIDAVWDCTHDKEAAHIYERLKEIGLPVFYRNKSKLIVCNVNDATIAAKIKKAFELQSKKSKTQAVKR